MLHKRLTGFEAYGKGFVWHEEQSKISVLASCILISCTRRSSCYWKCTMVPCIDTSKFSITMYLYLWSRASSWLAKRTKDGLLDRLIVVSMLSDHNVITPRQLCADGRLCLFEIVHLHIHPVAHKKQTLRAFHFHACKLPLITDMTVETPDWISLISMVDPYNRRRI